MEYNRRCAPTQFFVFFEGLAPRALFWDKAAPGLGCLVVPSQALAPAARFARADSLMGGSYLVDLSGLETSTPGAVLAFHLFFSWGHRSRLLLCAQAHPGLTSVDSVFSSAGWLEREFSEMFGCPLAGKADARNLLLDYALAEAPLRKSFPCTGRGELSFSAMAGGLVMAPGASVDL